MLAAANRADLPGQTISQVRAQSELLTFFIRVVNIRLVLQQDLADGGLAFKCRDEERSHAVPVTLVRVGSVVQEESHQPAVTGLKQKSANYGFNSLGGGL